MNEFFERLRQRRVVRWALAYLAGAWVAIEVTSQLGQLFDVPVVLQRAVVLFLAGGLLLTVVLAWFHGEKGRQRVSGTELIVLTAVLALTGVVLAVTLDDTRVGAEASTPADEAAAGSEGAAVGLPSVAVLPFTDLSPGGDQAYFSEGIAEELRSVLYQIEGLRVASSTSSLSIEDRNLDPGEIGRRLGVAHIVEGSVRKSDANLRIEARLVSVSEGFPVWSARFDTDASDIFAVQDSIARAVADEFQVRLGTSSDPIAPRGQTSDAVAQDLYLRGRFAWNRRTREGLLESLTHFRSAVERDPSYARAYAGLGDAWAVIGFYDHVPPSEAFPQAKAAASAALAIDSTMAEPHATLGYVALYHDWDWPAAERGFLEAVRLDPGYPVAHQWYANYLTAMGRFDEAAREMRAASELDPLSMIAFTAIGWVHFYARDYERALAQLESASLRDPAFALAHLWRGQVLEALGRLEDAEASILQHLALSDDSPAGRAALARVAALEGRDAEAGRILGELESEGRSGYVPRYEIARAYLALEDRDRAMALIRRAMDERAHSIAFLAVDPALDGLRGDPDFEEVLETLELADIRPGVTPRAPGPG